MDGSFVNIRDLLALYLSGTYYHETGTTRPPSCVTPRQPTIYLDKFSEEAVGRNVPNLPKCLFKVHGCL